jgi:hypothetical protein
MPTTSLAQNQELIKIIATIIFGIDLHSFIKIKY